MQDSARRYARSLTPEEAERCPYRQPVILEVPPCPACLGTTTQPLRPDATSRSTTDIQRIRNLLLTQLGLLSSLPGSNPSDRSPQDSQLPETVDRRGALIDALARRLSDDSDTFRGGARWRTHARRHSPRNRISARTPSSRMPRDTEIQRRRSTPVSSESQSSRRTSIHRRRSSTDVPRTRRESPASSPREIMSQDHIYRVAKRRPRRSFTTASNSSLSGKSSGSRAARDSSSSLSTDEFVGRDMAPGLASPMTTNAAPAQSQQTGTTLPTKSSEHSMAPRLSPRAPTPTAPVAMRKGRDRANAILNSPKVFSSVLEHLQYKRAAEDAGLVRDRRPHMKHDGEKATPNSSEDDGWLELPVVSSHAGGYSGGFRFRGAAGESENVSRPDRKDTPVGGEAQAGHNAHFAENVRPGAVSRLGGKHRSPLDGESYVRVDRSTWEYRNTKN